MLTKENRNRAIVETMDIIEVRACTEQRQNPKGTNGFSNRGRPITIIMQPMKQIIENNSVSKIIATSPGLHISRASDIYSVSVGTWHSHTRKPCPIKSSNSKVGLLQKHV